MSTIFGDINLEVDIDSLKRDLPEQARGRLLHQFRQSQTLNAVLTEISGEVQELYDAIIAVVKAYSLADAQGENLDVLGRIVGQLRLVSNAADKQWLGTDLEDTSLIGGQDHAPAYVENAALFGKLIVDDDTYRQLIKAKIFKNHTRAASIAEIILFSKFLTGVDVSYRTIGPMELELIVPVETPLRIINQLTSFIDADGVEKKHLIPIPATVSFSRVTYRPEVPFATDRVGCGPDGSKAALSREIN